MSTPLHPLTAEELTAQAKAHGLGWLVRGPGVFGFPAPAPLIKAFRHSQGWSQEALAARYGVSIRTVRRWESISGGDAHFDEPFRQLLAEALVWQTLSTPDIS